MISQCPCVAIKIRSRQKWIQNTGFVAACLYLYLMVIHSICACDRWIHLSRKVRVKTYHIFSGLWQIDPALSFLNLVKITFPIDLRWTSFLHVQCVHNCPVESTTKISFRSLMKRHPRSRQIAATSSMVGSTYLEPLVVMNKTIIKHPYLRTTFLWLFGRPAIFVLLAII